MKVLHLCLAAFYIDNYTYQENMLPKYHKKLGYDIEIIASLVSFNENGKPVLLENRKKYHNEFGIPVTRLEYQNSKLSRKLRKYKNTYESIVNSNPDIIFIHGVQFLDIKEVVRYCKKHPNVIVYVDNHADYSNSASNWLSNNILHKIIWRKCAHLINPYTTKFYGVLPVRVDFLKDVYKLPENKIELLVLGADDDKVIEAKNGNFRNDIRKKYNIGSKDFLIITGGKIDNNKRQILSLMKAVKNIDNVNVRLVIFGTVINELKEKVENLIDGKKIQHIGWINGEDCYKYFVAADLAVFPGKHSVLWEQAVGSGIPTIFNRIEGATHIDLGGNCEFLLENTVEEIEGKIKWLINNPNIYKQMKVIANTRGMESFSYSEIARQSIDYPKHGKINLFREV